ncbi:hypothetical protein Taro_056842 [Colocasia esculenta]|uniref:Uncharacterized protein n=1 Tax=Colocasia esculenta TaxID=4460 RepID=A0A843XXC4_COLES|nr:hypothetical protein [Colocasia esculenta]
MKASQLCRHRFIMCRHIILSHKLLRTKSVSGVDTSSVVSTHPMHPETVRRQEVYGVDIG